MNFNTSGYEATPIVTETLQDFYSTILEYYDELFPVAEDAIRFLLQIQEELKAGFHVQPSPLCRYLGIGCATGNLENTLAGHGLDVTGIDINRDMIETAKRRMKRGFSSSRFFEMSTIDMNRFLKQGSFHILGCLANTLPYIADETLIRKFFHDAHELLISGGKLVIQTLNYDAIPANTPSRLPTLSSIRVSLHCGYIPAENETVLLDAVLELGNGRKIILQKTTKLLPLSAVKVESFAREAGFTSCERFGSFTGEEWAMESSDTIFVFS